MSRLQSDLAEYQLVVFDVGNESFGVDIDSVQEIIRMQSITEVPGSSVFVRGIINLRGRIIPVLDLRERFGLTQAAASNSQRIVVVEVGGPVIGMVVDAVSEVLRIQSDCIEPPSAIVVGIGSDYIRGIAKIESKLVILLQLDRLLNDEQSEALHGLNAA
jgi:purine-binding chemotaxis protein CheW